ncbi:MAG: hypothetical protein PHE19_01805, partial [Candidatus Cloacimonetes bacterium]|nr:hypothetical protein [Candidatus Cloacimonadota bacterium]
MQKKIKCILFSCLLLLTACTSKYQRAKIAYEAGNYPIAIEDYDNIINKSDNGYEITLSELDRSESYYQLGMRAFERKNYNLAIRLFYLANSDKADDKIIDSYLEILDKSKSEDNNEMVIAIYDYIITNLYKSPRVPKYIFERANLIYDWYDDEQTVWADYCIMNEYFPESEYVAKTQVIVDKFLLSWVNHLANQKNNKDADLSDIIGKLMYLKSQPNSYHKEISNEIALIYIQMAESEIVGEHYVKAKKLFQDALEFDANQANYVQKRLEDICQIFINEGNELLNEKKIDEAITQYSRSFQIIEEYTKATNAITRAEQRRRDIAQSLNLKEEGVQLERKKKYQEALKKYQQAAVLDKTRELDKLIFEVSNIIEIEKDPRAFAMKVLREYKNGLIVKGVNDLRLDLKEEWGESLRDSGWKTIGAATRYKIEL